MVSKYGGGQQLTVTQFQKKFAGSQIHWEFSEAGKVKLSAGGSHRSSPKGNDVAHTEPGNVCRRRIARAELDSHLTCQVCGQPVSLLKSRVWG